jgi:hypothetical protein
MLGMGGRWVGQREASWGFHQYGVGTFGGSAWEGHWKLGSSRRGARVCYSVRLGFMEDLPPAAQMLEAPETSYTAVKSNAWNQLRWEKCFGCLVVVQPREALSKTRRPGQDYAGALANDDCVPQQRSGYLSHGRPFNMTSSLNSNEFQYGYYSAQVGRKGRDYTTHSFASLSSHLDFVVSRCPSSSRDTRTRSTIGKHSWP